MPSPDDNIDAPIPAPDGCLTSLGHEVAFTALATYLAESAMEQDEPAALAKLVAESIKSRRAAAALAIKREEIVALARLDRSRRAMAATNGPQRSPLKLVSGGQDR